MVVPPDVPLDAAPQASDADRAVRRFVMLQLFTLVVLQKVGIPMGGGQVLPLQVPLLLIGLGFLAARGVLLVDTLRFVLLIVFVVVAAVAHMSVDTFSLPSLLLVIGIYLPFVVFAKVDTQTLQWSYRLFITFMLWTAPIVALEWVLQLAVRPGQWLNLEALLPAQFVVPNFMYVRQLFYGQAWVQPNAGIFLESSIISQFLALAIVIEVVFFRRWLVLCVLGATMMGTMAGTGVLLLLIVSPLLIWRLAPRDRLLLVAAMVIGAIGLLSSPMASRILEFQSDASSSYIRFVRPLLVFADRLGSPDAWWTGVGAGNSNENDVVLWPAVKLLVEYGLLATISLLSLIVVSIIRGAPSLTVGFALLIFFNILGGGLAVPVYAGTVVLLGTLFRIRGHDNDDGPSIRAR